MHCQQHSAKVHILQCHEFLLFFFFFNFRSPQAVCSMQILHSANSLRISNQVLKKKIQHITFMDILSYKIYEQCLNRLLGTFLPYCFCLICHLKLFSKKIWQPRIGSAKISVKLNRYFHKRQPRTDKYTYHIFTRKYLIFNIQYHINGQITLAPIAISYKLYLTQKICIIALYRIPFITPSMVSPFIP